METIMSFITDIDYVIKNLENWKCDKCGCTEKPDIITKKNDNDELVEMYIKCKKCDKIITLSQFE